MTARAETTDSILLIDDDPGFAEELSMFLESYGIQCTALTDPSRAAESIATVRPDLLLLDQRMGAVTGTEVLRAVRASSTMPCVILTGLNDPIDRILGLELGADDYIHKSAMPREILARIRAVLRRTRSGVADGVTRAGGAWQLRSEERELYRPDGTRCHLTSAEFSLIEAFVEAPGTVLSRTALTERIFHRPYRVDDRAIDSLVVRLRRKIEADPEQPVMIKSVRLQGYVFSGFPADRALVRMEQV